MTNTNYVLPEYWGWFRPYPFILFFAFLAVVLCCVIKAKLKNLPLVPLEKYIFIVIPIGLIFASFFGKLDYLHPLPFYELFFFWEAGLSIHGAILGGLVAFFIFFPSQSKKYKISMWVWLDIILPNILLGQAIGRWGNFFNHEILGHVVSYDSLKWLPGFIRKNCFQFDLNAAQPFTPETDSTGNIIYRQPLFLYEMFGTFSLWIILTFIIPNIGKWFGHKPWKINPKEFANLSWKGKWNKVYYELLVDEKLAIECGNEYKHLKINSKLSKKEKLKIKFQDLNFYLKHNLHKNVTKLNKLHNPYNISVIRCGLTGSLFIFGYNFIRLFIEMQRSPQELFIKNLPVVSYTTIILFALLGIISAIFAQVISPMKWRKVHWYYEKQY